MKQLISFFFSPLKEGVRWNVCWKGCVISIISINSYIYPVVFFLYITGVSIGLFAQNNEYKATNNFTVVFYNVENLFDTIDDPFNKGDNDFLPYGTKNWTEKRYQKKLKDISKVLCSINKYELPEIIGLCEIENKTVLKALIKQPNLEQGKYEIIHEDSPDTRGIDVALLYRKDEFQYLLHKTFPVIYYSNKSRDILYVKGIASNTDTLHIFVNHWKARSGGQIETEPKRINAAKILREKVDSLFILNPNSNIIIIGDFNDNPTDKSLNLFLNATNKRENTTKNELYSLLYDKYSLNNEGTYFWEEKWNMLDDIIVSQNLLKDKKGYRISYEDGQIFKPEWILYKNKETGELLPNRTKYGGYSDHLPVYVILNR